jgi:hypothetical protein
MTSNIKSPPVPPRVLLRRQIEDCLRKNPIALDKVAELLKREGYIK